MNSSEVQCNFVSRSRWLSLEITNGPSPFIISSDSEREMLAKLSWSSLLYIWGGPVAALWGIWELLVVRPGLIGSPLSN